MDDFKVGISIGDLNGIGPETILKVFSDERMLGICTPVVYGSAKALAFHRDTLEDMEAHFQIVDSGSMAHPGRINVVNCWEGEASISLGEASTESGKYAYIALERAVDELKAGEVQALVTAPINKNAMQMAGFPHAGHTEYLTQATEQKDSLMLMVNDTLRVGLVTNHLPLKEVAAAITKERVKRKIMMMNESLCTDFGVEKPIIAVLGLNPHAGDNGVLGDEELKIIAPAIQEAQKNGILAMGPYPADGFFGSPQHRRFDGILAMYHDQGLVAFKSMSFGSGINFTAGLPIVRTSPDHGTAYDLAGKNQANPASLRQAIFLAKDVYLNRKEYIEGRANTVEHIKIREERQPGDSH